jgi:hypothetical protein
VVLVALGVALSGCQELVGKTVPVPAVHRLPVEAEGTVILIAEDPIIESKDPIHLKRAKEHRIPEDYRASMTTAFELAGFKVVSSPSERHDLVAKLALAVREEPGKVYQTYRCGLRGPDGTEVAQIDWAWPQGVFTEETEVLDFATHNVATEVVSSRRVIAYLQSARRAPPAATPDAGSSPAPAP